MGCPDWPKCFGQWVPPTEESEIPSDYKELYSSKRKAKNEKIASYLRMFGSENLANKIEGDASAYTELDFNRIKTWTEYLNRVLGVIIGIFVLLFALYSLSFLKTHPIITYLSFASLVLVIFQGWLGSIVVSTNLLPFTITVHMLVALAIVALIILALIGSSSGGLDIASTRNGPTLILIPLLILTIVQIISGTQVREEIDTISSSMNYLNREFWISRLSEIFNFHRIVSYLIIVGHVILVVVVNKKYGSTSYLLKTTFALFMVVMSELVAGLSLASFNIPAIIQPYHLLAGTLIFGIQFFLLIYIANRNELRTQVNN
jgi:cytochrome c oxidase assembly protein subunit 15